LTHVPDDFIGTTFKCSYFRGNRGTKSIPVILLHDWGGSRCDLEPLARRLQNRGCAVLVPELWPSVDCSEQPEVGDDESSAQSQLPHRAFWTLASAQFGAATEFLLKEHNKGALNCSLLCILADGHSGFLAANWTVLFDEYPSIEPLSKEKTLEIKALVFLSPRMLRYRPDRYLFGANSSIGGKPGLLIVGDQKEDSLNAARQVHASLVRYYKSYRARILTANPSRNLPQQPRLALVEVASQKQGIALVNEKTSVAKAITNFVDQYVGKHRNAIPWKIRVSAATKSAFEKE